MSADTRAPGGATSPDFWEARWKQARADAAADTALAINGPDGHVAGEWHHGRQQMHTLGADFVAPAAGAFVGAKARNTSGVVMNSGTGYDIALDTETFDTSAMHNPATNPERITIVEDGTYRCIGWVEIETYFDSPTTNPFYAIAVLFVYTSTIAFLSRAEDMVTSTPAAFNAGHRIVLKIDEVLPLAAGQWVVLNVFHNAGVQLVTSTDSFRQARLTVVKEG